MCNEGVKIFVRYVVMCCVIRCCLLCVCVIEGSVDCVTTNQFLY